MLLNLVPLPTAEDTDRRDRTRRHLAAAARQRAARRGRRTRA
jgi:hypothetical protein